MAVNYIWWAIIVLISAVAPKCLRNPWAGEDDGGGSGGGSTNTSGGAHKMEEPWAALSDRAFVAMVEQLFSHLLKVLNICAHVLDDTPPGPPVKVTEGFFHLSAHQPQGLLRSGPEATC